MPNQNGRGGEAVKALGQIYVVAKLAAILERVEA